METRVSSLGQGPGLAWKRSTSSFPPGSLAELQEWTGGKTEPPWHGDLTFQQWNTVGWAITDDGVLCIKPWEGVTGETGPLTSSRSTPWDDNLSAIKKIESIGTIVLNASSQSLISYCKVTDLASLADWNTSNVTDMGSMFERCPNLADLTGLARWDVSNVTEMSYMFSYCRSLTDMTGLDDWNVSNVTNMKNMFSGCSGLTNLTPLAHWNVSNVTNMSLMFSGCTKIQKIGIPSIANGGQKLVENAKNASLTTVLPSIVSEDGSMGPYTWDELNTEMTTHPDAFKEGTVLLKAEEAVQ